MNEEKFRLIDLENLVTTLLLSRNARCISVHVISLVVREMLLVIFVGIAVGVISGVLCGRYVES